MKRKIVLLSVWVGLMAVVFVPSASASPIVAAEFKLDGTWLYSYDVNNDGADSLYDFGIDFFGDPFNITGPDGWVIFSGNGEGTASGLGFIDWFSPDPTIDLAPGQTLAGFSFQSTLGPGSIVYHIATATEALDGGTTGPTTGTNPVPEPGTLVLLGSGITLAIARRRRSQLQA
jgi:PEP-CTERM motif